MKANRKSLLANDTRAQVGIGTMIVFIATILVAATAAAVLIDTSGKLQERSSSTGNEATKQVASNLVLSGLHGNRTFNGSTQDNLHNLTLVVSLAPGASSVDLEQVKIRITDGSTNVNLGHDSGNSCTAGNNDIFCLTELRDPKGSFGATTYVLSSGGLVEITIPLWDADQGNGLTLPPRKAVSMLVMPEVGSPLLADFITPTSFGEDPLIELR